MNRPDGAIELASRATAMDPLNPWTFAVLCGVRLDTGHPAEAESDCRRAVEIDPSAAVVHSALAIALLTNYKPLDAAAEARREPDPQFRLRLLPIVLDAAGRKTDAERELKELQMRYGEQNGDWVALYYACQHDFDDAVHWLRTYAASHQELRPYQPYLRACMDNLKPDPRYRELERQLRFAPRSE